MAATNRDGIVGTISRAGLADTPTAIDATNGETWTNDGTQWIEIVKGAGTALTASVPYLNTFDGQTIPPKTLSISATSRKEWGPFPVEKFGSAPVITWSGDTTNATFNIRKLGS